MIKSGPWTGGTDEEYETQYFGFGAQRFKIAVRQMVEQKIRSNVGEMESILQTSLKKLNDEDKIALTVSCDNIIRLYCDRAGPCLDIIDEEIERILNIPPNVLLPEDEIQMEQTTDKDYNTLKEEVTLLRQRVEQSALMSTLLASEVEELSSIEKVCEVAKKDMEELDLVQSNLDDSGSVKDILSSVQFLSASVPFIQEGDIFEE